MKKETDNNCKTEFDVKGTGGPKATGTTEHHSEKNI